MTLNDAHNQMTYVNDSVIEAMKLGRDDAEFRPIILRTHQKADEEHKAR